MVFTSGATESNNIVVKGVPRFYAKGAKKKVNRISLFFTILVIVLFGSFLMAHAESRYNGGDGAQVRARLVPTAAARGL